MVRILLPIPKEKQVQAGIVTAIRTLGGAAYSTSQSRPSKVSFGIPDLMVFHRNRFAFVEVKRPGGKPSPAQVEFGARCRAAGIEWHIWESATQAVEWITRSIEEVEG